MFLAKFPYSDNQQLNLDWVIEQIRFLSDAAHIDFDDTIAALGADNVQGAIEKLKELLDLYASQLSGVAIIDSAIPEANFTGGYTYNHLQTVNDPTLTAIIDAVKLSRYIVLKRHSGNMTGYFICSIINEIPGDYKHQVILIDPVTLVTSEIDIYGINDADNIYCDIIADVNQTRVNSFNGRDGAVTPEDADYDASQVVYDDSNTGLNATRVQTAIEALKALIPLLFVASFNGRNGAVTPASGDYDASMIDYDNSVSGLTATDAQAAIDEIVSLVLASGVASFNGRTGAVNPQSGDYDASMIAIDTSNTDLPASVDTVQKYINYEHPAVATITLTLNGAKEDTITVEDSNGATIGTCVFAAGQTTGTITTTVPSGYSDTWTFTSSVSKDTTNIANDYVKTATVTDATAQTINVYPDGAVYWYGNKLGNTLTNNPGNCTMSFTEATNSFTYSLVTDVVGDDPYIGIAKNLTGLTSCGAIYSASKATNSQARVFLELSGVTTQVLVCYDGTDPDTIPTKVKTNTFTSRDCDHIRLTLTPYFNGTNSITVYALWLE